MPVQDLTAMCNDIGLDCPMHSVVRPTRTHCCSCDDNGVVQVTNVVRSGDIQLQPHHIFVVRYLLDDAVQAAIYITKPGLIVLSLLLLT